MRGLRANASGGEGSRPLFLRIVAYALALLQLPWQHAWQSLQWPVRLHVAPAGHQVVGTSERSEYDRLGSAGFAVARLTAR